MSWEGSGLRLIHTSDWHIGKVFRSAGDSVMSVLQQARLDAIGEIGELAIAQNARTILVAGDIYDKESPENKTLAQPLEQMRRFPSVTWHLIPGNHDPDLPNGLWDRVLSIGLPENVQVHRDAAPVSLDDRSWLLPAPLRQKHSTSDPTAWMDAASTPEGHLRIGLAHGSISDFGSSVTTPNLIAPDRAKRAGLAYLALGDWHAAKAINPRTWYSGSPEPDNFGRAEDGQPEAGQALLVDLQGEAAPSITQQPTGRFLWLNEKTSLHGDEDIRRLEQRIREVSPDLSRLVLRLHVEGLLSLGAFDLFERTIAETGLAAGLCSLDLKREHLAIRPAESELDQLTDDRVIKGAIARLRLIAETEDHPERQAASRAVWQLYLACHKRRPEVAA